jgi:hypothetical protein
MRLAAVLLTLVASSALAQGASPAPAKAPAAKAPAARPAETKPAETKPAQRATEAKQDESSILTVRCMDDCSVRVDGAAGMRRDPRTWEFKNVTPGQHRIEVTGGLITRPLFNGYADVPGGMRVVAQIDSNKRLTIIERTPLTQEKEAKASGTEPSLLNVRCAKPCTVSVDGARKGAGQSQLVVARDVPPGERSVEVKFTLGKTVRMSLDVPAGSEVFVTATESGIHITNTRPL